MQKKRFFIAINLPNEIKIIIKSLQSSIDKKYYNITDRNNLHITLLFLDYLKEDEILKVQNILKNSVPIFPSFMAHLSDIIFFPSSNNPRIISITVKSEESLEKIQKILQNKLSELNFINPEKRKFKAHITIARLKDKKDKVSNLKNIKAPGEKWEISKITFMESILQPKSAKHTTLQEFKLKQNK
jgi:RNA 2',3'-cyclic 3'-phosphodiesterase